MRSCALRLAAAVAAASMLATVITASPAAGAAGFGDVAADAFYTDPVQWLVDESITTGTSPGCFSPNRDVTRGEVATFLWRYAGEPDGGTEAFTDVKPGNFFADAVAWMASNDITTGTSPTTFEPDRDVTRGEVATFLWRYAGEPDGGTEAFTDVKPGNFFADAVAWMASNDITTGTSPTTFEPDRPLTRAEMATFLWRYDGEPAVNARAGGTCPEPGTPDPPKPPPGDGGFDTLPPGSTLPSGAACAQRVLATPEIRPANTPYNTTVGSGPHPELPRVTGDFTGTTDEILQWVACKWGIHEDIVRAQVAKESWWDQEAGGDLSSNPADCHPSVRNMSPCPESLGILQVRFLYHTAAMDDAIASTAYNADYTYAAIRSCYEGNETWLGPAYSSGDLWGCLGVWFSGRWRDADALGYIDAVGELLDQRIWEQPVFRD